MFQLYSLVRRLHGVKEKGCAISGKQSFNPDWDLRLSDFGTKLSQFCCAVETVAAL